MADDRAELLWQSYFIPATTVLRNDLGITDAAALRDAEYAIAGQRLQQLERGDVQIPRTFDDAHLAAIHKHLFQDCYAWAGQPRYVDMAKNGAVFAPVPEEVLGQMWDAKQLHNSVAWKELDREGFAQAIGAYAAHTNYSHPFREGNGRAAKLLYNQVAQDTQFRIDWDRVSPEEWNQASRASVAAASRGGTPDPTPLVAVFRGMTVPRDPGMNASGRERHQEHRRSERVAAQFTPTPAALQAATRSRPVAAQPAPLQPQAPARYRARGY